MLDSVHSDKIHSHNIEISLLNARSIVNKLTCLQSYVISSSVDVIAITESWLNDRIYDNEILPQNQYTIYRRDRGSRGVV